MKVLRGHEVSLEMSAWNVSNKGSEEKVLKGDDMSVESLSMNWKQWNKLKSQIKG